MTNSNATQTSSITCTINVSEASGVSTIGIHEPALSVETRRLGTKRSIKLDADAFSLGGDYDGLTVLLSPGSARALVEALEAELDALDAND